MKAAKAQGRGGACFLQLDEACSDTLLRFSANEVSLTLGSHPVEVDE